MNPTLPIRIVIADDHSLFRAGFSQIIATQAPEEIDFVGEANNGAELLQLVDRIKPDVVITDVRMPVLNGIQATAIIKKKHPDIRVIAFSTFYDLNFIIPMLNAGADGYLSKNCEKGEIITAIQCVFKGEQFYCSTISKKLFTNPDIRLKKKKLRAKEYDFNEKELAVMQYICMQLSTKEIADKMKLAVRTVENYRHDIQRKIGAVNMVGVALYSVFNGIASFAE